MSKRNAADTERLVFEFIRGRLVETGMAPTFREIGVACGFASNNSTNRYVSRLVRAGLIRKLAHRHRAMELVAQHGWPAGTRFFTFNGTTKQLVPLRPREPAKPEPLPANWWG